MLLTQLDRKVASQAKRRLSDDIVPPQIINLEDITCVHAVPEDVANTSGQSQTYACIVEAVVSTRSLFFAAHRIVRQCMRFVFREDLVEWVASLKACIVLAHCPRT